MKIFRVISAEEAASVCGKLADWAEGKARTEALTGTVKRNEEILDHPLLATLGQKLHAKIQLDAIPLKSYRKFSRYRPGQQYHAHTDAPWMGDVRTDLSCTLWLNDDYEGGELVIGGRKVRGKPGECILYDCGSIHEVLPVTSGERIAMVAWIQSRIRDSAERALIGDFRRWLRQFEGNPEFLEGSRIYSAILRRWIE